LLNIKFSHREAEDPQEPVQTWLDVKRIEVSMRLVGQEWAFAELLLSPRRSWLFPSTDFTFARVGE
jgi:hypothetical protein